MKSVLILVCVCLLVWACKNEPYEVKPLGVTSLITYPSSIQKIASNTQFFTYHQLRLYTFLSKSPTDTLLSIKFRYSNDMLTGMTLDSTKRGWKFATFTTSNDGTVVTDSITAFDATDTTHITSAIYSVRTVTHDTDGNPIAVNLKTWPDGVLSEQLAELTWDGGNVVHLVNSTITDGNKTVMRDLSISHDDKFCVYTKESSYLYTLALKDLYWLSTNNPIVFTEGDVDKKYTFWYNKLGYPSNYQSDTNILYGATYTQIR